MAEAPTSGAAPGEAPVSREQALPPGASARWRSPIRGPWLTSVLGIVLLVGIPVEFVTGLLSYAAYNPRLVGNDPNPSRGALGTYLFSWFTSPSWVYRLVEGVHVFLGLALVPVVLAKLWSVMPELFAWPPFRTLARLLERLTLLVLVGGVLVEMGTGILNIDYRLGYGTFYPTHFYGAWIFISAFAVHVALRFGRMVTALRSRSFSKEMRTGVAATVPEEADDVLVAARPAAPTISRRGALALVGAASLAVLGLTSGETLGGRLRATALFGTHDSSPGNGPNAFPVNHTAAAAGVGEQETGSGWRLRVTGARTLELSRDDLLSMPLLTATLPIACTEGWSTVQRWTGVRLRALAELAGTPQPAGAALEALDGSFVSLSSSQARAGESMVALKVNGADLSLDHGYPARVMVPAAPGTHNKKWISRITFEGTR